MPDLDQMAREIVRTHLFKDFEPDDGLTYQAERRAYDDILAALRRVEAETREECARMPANRDQG